METQALVPDLGLGDADMNLVSMSVFSLNYLPMNVDPSRYVQMRYGYMVRYIKRSVLPCAFNHQPPNEFPGLLVELSLMTVKLGQFKKLANQKQKQMMKRCRCILVFSVMSCGLRLGLTPHEV